MKSQFEGKLYIEKIYVGRQSTFTWKVVIFLPKGMFALCRLVSEFDYSDEKQAIKTGQEFMRRLGIKPMKIHS